MAGRSFCYIGGADYLDYKTKKLSSPSLLPAECFSSIKFATFDNVLPGKYPSCFAGIKKRQTVDKSVIFAQKIVNDKWSGEV
jgi:hypothetical protein